MSATSPAEKLACLIGPIVRDIVNTSQANILRDLKTLENQINDSRRIQEEILVNLQDIKMTLNIMKRDAVLQEKQLQQLNSNTYQTQFDAIMRKLNSIDATICRMKLGLSTHDIEQGAPENVRVQSNISKVNLFSNDIDNIDIDCD